MDPAAKRSEGNNVHHFIPMFPVLFLAVLALLAVRDA
jgi:hypothetical protein